MGTYQEMIIEDTGCAPGDAGMIEHIMREDIFHGTLDWQSRSEFRRAARTAAAILAEDWPLYEEFFAKTRAVFDQMKASQQPAEG
jgi:hypothetical protein